MPAVPGKIIATLIAPDVLELLRSGTWSLIPNYGVGFVMPQSSRELYQKTTKVLKAFGGNWVTKAKATIFDDEDAETAVRQACETGFYVDPKKAYQFFETPPEVAELMIQELRLITGTYTVLEPSAGNGALIVALTKTLTDDVEYDLQIAAVELDPVKQKRLQELTGSSSQPLKQLACGDFLQLDPQTHTTELFDRVMMNPPFSKSQDIKHVRHAYNFLKPGGILVSVMSPGFTFRLDSAATLFREWLEMLSGGSGRAYHVPLPDGSFKASGTNVKTVMLVIEKRK